MKPNHFRSPPDAEHATGNTVSLFGCHDYDIVVGSLTRLRPSLIVQRLAAIYPGDFDLESAAFDSVDHQVLHAAMDYNIFRLADPQFDAADYLCGQLEAADVIDRIDAHPIAGAISVDRTIIQLTAKLKQIDPDGAKALWAALSFAQEARLPDFDLMTAPWWSAAFILTWPSRSQGPKTIQAR